MIFIEILKRDGIVIIPNFFNEKTDVKFKNEIHLFEKLSHFSKLEVEITKTTNYFYSNNIQRINYYYYIGEEDSIVSFNNSTLLVQNNTLIICKTNNELIFNTFSKFSLFTTYSLIQEENKKDLLVDIQEFNDYRIVNKFTNLDFLPLLSPGFSYSSLSGELVNRVYEEFHTKISDLLQICTCKIINIQISKIDSTHFSTNTSSNGTDSSIYLILEGSTVFDENILEKDTLIIIKNIKDNQLFFHKFSNSKNLILLKCQLEK